VAAPPKAHGSRTAVLRRRILRYIAAALDRLARFGLHVAAMTSIRPAFPAPDHDHDRCAADAITHAEQVCEQRSQKFTPIRRHVLQALLSSHRPLGAYEVIDELAKSMPRPAPITVYRALDFLMANGLVHRIESRNAYLACAQDHDKASMVAFLICDRCG
jgi:Fur family transcriptional regulator, zinc uptake regulator